MAHHHGVAVAGLAVPAGRRKERGWVPTNYRPMVPPNAGVQIKPLTIALGLLGAVLIVVAVAYFTKTANDLPSFFPGHSTGVTRHHTKHGIAMLGLAVLAFIGAWFSSAPNQNS
jgi:hypothetical protein